MCLWPFIRLCLIGGATRQPVLASSAERGSWTIIEERWACAAAPVGIMDAEDYLNAFSQTF